MLIRFVAVERLCVILEELAGPFRSRILPGVKSTGIQALTLGSLMSVQRQFAVLVCVGNLAVLLETDIHLLDDRFFKLLGVMSSASSW